MKDKELRGFEFLILVSQILNIFKLSEPKILEEIGWLKWLDEMQLLSVGAFVVYLIGLYRYDAIRINIIFILITQSLILIHQYNYIPDTLKTINLMLCLLFVLLSSLVYYFFPVLRQIPTTGKFRVGYTTANINSTDLAIFYPTDDKYHKKTDVRYMPYSQYFDVLHFMLTKMTKERMKIVPPKWLVKLSGQVMKRRSMGVINQANLKVIPNKIPLVIYSHGLSSHMNYQASFCKDMASKGCIVLSLQHKDEDFLCKINEPIQVDDFVNAQHQSVLRRKEQVKQVLDFVLKSKENLASLFSNSDKLKQSSNFELNDRIMIAGHSYGGQTALVSALEDDRIYATIAFDPVMNLFDLPAFKHLIEKTVKKPFLIICTDNFKNYFPFYKQKEGLSQWIKYNKNEKNLLIPLHFKNSEHCDLIDAALFQPRELQILRKDVCQPNNVTMNLLMLNKLAEFFMFETLNVPKIDSEKILNRFDDMCKNNIKQDNPLELIKE